MATYRSNQQATRQAENGVCVTTQGTDTSGGRLVFQSRAQWVEVSGAGNKGEAGPGAGGIYTKGQMQCMAIIVARFEQGVWTEAHLAHVSSDRAALINEFVEKRTHDDSYVAIGGKPGSIRWMVTIASKFGSRKGGVGGVWIYVSGAEDSPDFGMNSHGFFGETHS